MTGTVLFTYEILLRCMHDLVLDKIVIPYTAKKFHLVCDYFNMDFCNKYSYLWFVAKLFFFLIY